METERNKSVAAGVCLGASTVTVVKIEKDGTGYRVSEVSREPHFGNVFGTLKRSSEQLSLAGLPCCVTGRNVRKVLGLQTISEPEAVELSVRYFLPEKHPYRVVISAGGEAFALYHLDAMGCVQQLYSGNKCASGTGEFFLQQLHRMNLSLDEIKTLSPKAIPYHVSGRCSVFCKSDCTHALNKGIDKASVVAGLSEMMADKIEELFRKIPKDHAVLIGGCVLNKGLTTALGKRITDLYIPPEAAYFEALGAAIWASRNGGGEFPATHQLQLKTAPLQSDLAPLRQFKGSVTFNQFEPEQVKSGDRLLLGLDVGSTTTKGVLVKADDFGMVASSYQRTNGDPIRAARNVYKALDAQIGVPVEVVGLGVTGSGRQIAGLHAGATCVVNEIIAHATGAAHFDPKVDTILEIGGQDAKYIRLINGVPNDYAMNEACSAGTGSFLEESAKESLGIDFTEIGEIALASNHPANFNDQCSAFIGSDIKNAVQQHISTSDIVAGLVYSIGANYINRVVGNRPIGNNIFVQGGVCYNRAVPAALAALTGKEVVVPPDPGLMGALGIAMETAKREKLGMAEYGRFDLHELSSREACYRKPFICRGGGGRCDRKCEIAVIEVAGKKIPFGGVCNRYDNLAGAVKGRSKSVNGVAFRQRLIFGDKASGWSNNGPTIKMNRSLLVNSLFPFYRTFFEELGCRVILPEHFDNEGVTQRGAPFCFPVEIAHGFMPELLRMEADYLFSPLLKGVPVRSEQNLCTCVFVQSEPYYLAAAFPDMSRERVLNPVLDLSDEKKTLHSLQEVAVRLGFSKMRGKRSYQKALKTLRECDRQIKETGAVLLSEIEADDDGIGIVLFGRPYSAFADEANKGIPLKFAARGVTVIPYDMISFEDEKLADGHNMYWAMGSLLLRCAHYVARHPRLYGTFVTNFSCGPDSFLVTYFRDIMGTKPSLTLELDSHTADAGIETRIEAFLDIVRAGRRLREQSFSSTEETAISCAASVEFKGGRNYFRRSNGDLVPFTDPRVKVMIPSMAKFGMPLLARAFARFGMHAEVMPPADSEILEMGRSASSCKECLPLHTTLGSLLNYVRYKRPAGELTVYFMPSAPGPCRFGQYNVFMKRMIRQEGFRDVAVLSPTSENCYGGIDTNDSIAAWRSIVIGDLFDEMWSTILTAAVHKEEALTILNETHARIADCIGGDWKTLRRCLRESAERLSAIHLTHPYNTIPKISLVGEIYVRHDPISLQSLIERMAERGFIVRTAQNSEWIKYLDWLINNKIMGKKTLSFRLGRFLKQRTDSQIRNILSPCGLFYHGDMTVEPVVRYGQKFLSPHIQGEAILTVGAAFHDILNPSCGVISIGPFGCMPSRVAEAVLTEKFTAGEKENFSNACAEGFLPCPAEDRKLPFLAIETDGKPFPPLIEARIEAFCLQAQRLNEEMLLPLN